MVSLVTSNEAVVGNKVGTAT